MSTYKSCLIVAGSLFSVALLSGTVLLSNTVSADTEVIDQISLTVPIACTMSGTGTTHSATLNPGAYSGASGSEYENGIGKTTLTAICNDDNGFSIYAIGYTGNEYGTTSLIGENTERTIATKAYASGDTTSNWSMKLTKVDNPVSGDPVTYNPANLTISTGYDAWHAVPDTYTKVAQYKASTGSSTTDTTLGVKLETTYAAYIATNQPADTYVGQVKYTMVHPYDASAPKPRATRNVTITYSTERTAGEFFFDSEMTQTENVVTYSTDCAVDTRQYDTIKTSNLDENGDQDGSYSSNEYAYYYRQLPDASKVKIVVTYGFTANTGGVWIAGNNNQEYLISSEEENISGTNTYILDGREVGISMWTQGNSIGNYNYGAYIRVYPLDENDDEIMVKEYSDCVDWQAINGTYMIPQYHSRPGIMFDGWDGDYYLSFPYHLFSESDVLLHLSSLSALPDNIIIYAMGWE